MENVRTQQYRDRITALIKEMEVDKKRLKEFYEQENFLIKQEIENFKNPRCGIWIDVNDEKPKRGQAVLVFYENTQVCAIYRGYWMIDSVLDEKLFDNDKVTHWMPLPPNPKAK